MNAFRCRRLAVVLAVGLSLACGPRGSIAAQEPPPVGVPEDSSRAPDADSLPAVLDSLARQVMERGRIPGLAVVLVRDGDVAWSRGYGRETLDGGPPVSPRATRFPVGSISKLVTAVAVMQLVEEERLGLDADVRKYVPDAVPLTGPGGAVTLHHLLTHTAGFESSSIGLAARSPEGVEPLREVLVERMPRRVRRPGLLYLYSQFDYGLAGLAVQTVSGRPFEDYADERIFSPLGMTTASFRAEALRHERAAAGYHWTGEGSQRAPTAYHHVPPAGGLVATPADLGRLMARLLPDRRDRAAGILQAETVRRMFARQWSPHEHPKVEGTGYGLFEYRACGFRALSTRGWVGGHSSYLHLLPEQGLGFLVVGNASSLEGLESGLRLAVHRRLPGSRCGGDSSIPSDEGPSPDSSAAGAPPGSAEPLEGVYRSMGFGARGVEGLGRRLLSPTLELRADEEGPVLELGGDPEPASRVDSLLLRVSWGPGREEFFSFMNGPEAGSRYLAWEGSMYERVASSRSPTTLRRVAGLVAAVLSIGLLVGLGRTIYRLRTRTPSPLSERLARVGGLVVSLLPLLFAGGMAFHLTVPARFQFAFGIPDTVLPFLWLPPFWTALGVGLVLAGRRVWRERYWSVGERLLWTLVGVLGLASGLILTVLGIPAM